MTSSDGQTSLGRGAALLDTSLPLITESGESARFLSVSLIQALATRRLTVQADLPVALLAVISAALGRTLDTPDKTREFMWQQISLAMHCSWVKLLLRNHPDIPGFDNLHACRLLTRFASLDRVQANLQLPNGKALRVDIRVPGLAAATEEWVLEWLREATCFSVEGDSGGMAVFRGDDVANLATTRDHLFIFRDGYRDAILAQTTLAAKPSPSLAVPPKTQAGPPPRCCCTS